MKTIYVFVLIVLLGQSGVAQTILPARLGSGSALQVLRRNAGNSDVEWSFDGSGLTNLNASNLASGTVPMARRMDNSPTAANMIPVSLSTTVAGWTNSLYGQTFNSATISGGFIMAGSSSGTLTLAPPATASGTLTFPNGTDTLIARATTDTLTGKTLDAAATGNVLKMKGYIYLTHPHMVDGTGATLGTTATAIGYGHATFSHSADKAVNYAEYYFQVPEDIDTGVALRGRLKVVLGGADTADQNWLVSSVSVADSTVPTSSTLANEIALDYTADGSGASGDVETTAWTTLTSWAGALTAGQTWRIRLMRDGDTSDASTVNSTELGLVIEYGVTQ